MAQSTAGSIPQPVTVPVIPLREWMPWGLFGGLLMLLMIYFVGAEQGATSFIHGRAVHEFVHDPSVGNPETIGVRTGAYFLLITISIVTAILALKARRGLSHSLGDWNATLLGVLLYVIVVSLCIHFLPAIDEVPANFPASLLWKFRIASWGAQAVLWGVLGLLFGWLTERAEGMVKLPSQRANPADAVRYS